MGNPKDYEGVEALLRMLNGIWKLFKEGLDQEHWCADYLALNREGLPVFNAGYHNDGECAATEPDAHKFCLMGACKQALGNRPPDLYWHRPGYYQPIKVDNPHQAWWDSQEVHLVNALAMTIRVMHEDKAHAIEGDRADDFRLVSDFNDRHGYDAVCSVVEETIQMVENAPDAYEIREVQQV